MALIRLFTSIPQSKVLAEILPSETADLWYHGHYSPWKSERKYDDEPCPFHSASPNWDLPCWNLITLLDSLRFFTTPTAFSVKVCVPLLRKTKEGYSLTYTGDYKPKTIRKSDTISPIEIVADNLIDACYMMIVKLHEQKYG